MPRDSFDLFWAAYPRRTKKPIAQKAFAQALKKVSLDVMLTALEWQREQESWSERDESGVLRFVPHASTWLNQERWDDEQPQKKPGAIMPLANAASCGQCIEGWREDSQGRVSRCACRAVKVKTA